jgi:arylsulfatase A-like enzyme
MVEPREILLVITADHGDEFFEHGSLLHGFTLYQEQLHIPLIFSWAGKLKNQRVESLSDHLDLHATLADLAGAEEVGDGTSLWPEILQRRPAADPFRVRFASASSLEGGIFLARWQDLKYLWAPRRGHRWGQGQGPGRTTDAEFLYDLAGDPGEQVNQARRGSMAEEWLRSRLVAWVEKGKLAEQKGEMPELDAEREAQLRALGYLD